MLPNKSLCLGSTNKKKKEAKIVVFKDSSHAYSSPPLRLSNSPQVTSTLTPAIKGKTGSNKVGIPRRITPSNPS